jgi:uncharacterized protein YeaO (DUF488 family)
MTAKRKLDIRLKRAYEPASREDGRRVLVDRLWPRGVTKEALAIERWIKEIAPSAGLRRWFGHDPERWDEFRRRYARELEEHAALLDELRAIARAHPLTLVYAAHDTAHNDAIVLREALLGAQPVAAQRAPAKRKAPAAARPAAGAAKRKSGRVATRRASVRRARRSPRR